MCLFSDECFTFSLRFVLSSLLKSVRNDASNMVKLVFNQSWNDRAVTISGIAKKPRNKIWVKIGLLFFLHPQKGEWILTAEILHTGAFTSRAGCPFRFIRFLSVHVTPAQGTRKLNLLPILLILGSTLLFHHLISLLFYLDRNCWSISDTLFALRCGDLKSDPLEG